MDRIAAADNLTIEMLEDRWRLIANGGEEQHILVEAQPGKPVRYINGFATSRRLPEVGVLPPEHIQRVVLGWSNNDEAWHLGLVLNPELAQARGSRWCEMASWPDPDMDIYAANAQRAGEALAQTITRPFYLVPIKREAQTRPITEPPFSLGEWTFERRSEDVFTFTRKKGWKGMLLRRAIWYTLWVVVYIILIVTTLSGKIAPANPAFLPYLGIVSALILAGLIGKNLYEFFSWPDRIVVDGSSQSIRALRGKQVRWRYQHASLQSVYVSQVLGKNKRRDVNSKPTSYYGELNFQLSDSTFWYILNIDETQEVEPVNATLPEDEAVVELSSQNYHSQLQATALYVAKALDVPCWYDKRSV
ncbi:MAG: PAS domain-containing protein [Anaerolineae bacterium]|nr:PAS domain-containing protein [Anaerolineae bacterium]